MDKEEMRRRLEGALEKLLNQDADLLRLDVNERSITHRLAVYLEEQFPGWHVDCEYNRLGAEPKRIHEIRTQLDSATGEPMAEDTIGRTVYPDVVIHRRGTDENLLVLELKKSSNPLPRSLDEDKIRAYRSEPQLGYQFGAYVEVPTGQAFGSSPSIRFL